MWTRQNLSRGIITGVVALVVLAGELRPARADHWRYEWIGTAPFCGGKKSDCSKRGMLFVRFDKRGDGKACTTGRKVLCKKLMKTPRRPPEAGAPRYVWIGTAPFCAGKPADCTRRGMRFVRYDKRGDGKTCTSGRKVLCVTDATILRSMWVGTAPACAGRRSDCESRDMDYVRASKKGDGALCLSGTKVLCRERPMPARNASGDRANIFNVLNWNIFSRPFVASHDGQHERMWHIPRAIAGMNGGMIDAIVFEEAFLTGAIRDQMLRNLGRAGFGHVTNLTTKVGKLSNGGVFIASRWPILQQKHYVYSKCDGSDCLAAKGVVYARIHKTVGAQTRIYHVFGTHMQAWSTPVGNRIRLQQAAELRRFVARQRIGRNQPVIIAGDLNADNIGHAKHAAAVIRAAGAVMPTRLGARTFTSHPADNQLVGSDGSASDGKCEKSYLRTHTCRCCKNEFLDYVVYSAAHQRPRAATYQILRPKAARAFPACMSAKVQPHHVEPYSPFCKATWTLRDLSDHYPVLGRFQF